MQHALDLLEATTTTVGAVGRQLGYDSEAAFCRAFTRVVGLPPSAARARARTLDSPLLISG